MWGSADITLSFFNSEIDGGECSAYPWGKRAVTHWIRAVGPTAVAKNPTAAIKCRGPSLYLVSSRGNRYSGDTWLTSLTCIEDGSDRNLWVHRSFLTNATAIIGITPQSIHCA
jgi:hypothetical protein